MQGADVREDSGIRESDAETCHAKGRLWQPAPFLWRRDDEARVGAVGSGSDDGVPGPIRIDRYVGGRILKVHRLLSEGNGMREDRSLVIPFDRLTGTDSDILVRKTHSRDSLGAAVPVISVIPAVTPSGELGTCKGFIFAPWESNSSLLGSSVFSYLFFLSYD